MMNTLQHSAGADRALMLALGAFARLAGRYRPMVLRYHSIDPSGSRLSVSLDNFAAQMSYLKRARFPVVPLAEAAADGARGRMAALTFDDGYRNYLADARPLLERLRFPVTLYIAPGLLGHLPPWATTEQEWLKIMSADELCLLAEMPGVEFGAHTLTHPRLDQLDSESARREIEDSRDRLAQLVGRPVDTFCYPHGAYTTETVELVRRSGFKLACTVEPGSAMRLKSRFEICRVYVSPAMTVAEFAAVLTSASDWRLGVRGTLRKAFGAGSRETQPLTPNP